MVVCFGEELFFETDFVFPGRNIYCHSFSGRFQLSLDFNPGRYGIEYPFLGKLRREPFLVTPQSLNDGKYIFLRR